MSIRETKGRDIADRARIEKSGALYLVPSQSGGKKYKVDPVANSCSCPDFEFTGFKCKHQYAVEFTVERERKTVTETKASGATKTTVTETVKVSRKTYPQQWPAYNMAQTKEKGIFLYLLHQLAQGVGSPAQTMGRPRHSFEDMIFAMAFKVYSTVSGRRFMTDLRDAHARGYIENLPCYNSIFNYFESEALTPYLQMLIEESALPLASIEQDFAADSSGLSTGVFKRWSDAKWGKARTEFGDKVPNQVNRRDWLKIHIMCGVTTNVVTAVEVTDAHAADSRYFKPLVETTAQGFTMRQVSGDKAYLSSNNLKTVVDNHAMPYIPFKANSTGKAPKSSDLFKRMYHFYAYNQERFMQNYHKRSNVESTFHMIKAKFGDSLRSKTERAQINEALCKVLCHNICCLIQSMYELNLKPKFWKEVA
ncbi:MAG TPA: transposase [Pyrinomonadaceae bacterium]|jgi:transposase